MSILIPQRLITSCLYSKTAREWLEHLPETIATLAARWGLQVGPPWDHDGVSAAWVAPVLLPDHTEAVLKIGMPHMEGEDEIAGLRFWNGNGTVFLLDSDQCFGAMLLERCQPGWSARTLPETEQDVIAAHCLRSLWQAPPSHLGFRPLTQMLAYWTDEIEVNRAAWQDTALVQDGLDLFRSLPQTADQEVLLATDLHAGNILRAQREPWLVIDPKPFRGDPAYDGTQHLLNCRERLHLSPADTICRFADLLEIDRKRLGAWVFARTAANTGFHSSGQSEWPALARILGRTFTGF